jgi:hypothetical protein
MDDSTTLEKSKHAMRLTFFRSMASKRMGIWYSTDNVDGIVCVKQAFQTHIQNDITGGEFSKDNFRLVVRANPAKASSLGPCRPGGKFVETWTAPPAHSRMTASPRPLASPGGIGPVEYCNPAGCRLAGLKDALMHLGVLID